MLLQTVVSSEQVQRVGLILNTLLLIAMLIVIELIYAENTKSKRRQMYYFLPLLFVLSGLLIFAAYKQQQGL